MFLLENATLKSAETNNMASRHILSVLKTSVANKLPQFFVSFLVTQFIDFPKLLFAFLKEKKIHLTGLVPQEGGIFSEACCYLDETMVRAKGLGYGTSQLSPKEQ